MEHQFYEGFEKEAGIFRNIASKIKNVFNKPKLNPKPKYKPTDFTERYPRGSVIMPAKKSQTSSHTTSQPGKPLNYDKINSDFRQKELARLKRLREGGSSIQYQKMGDPIVRSPARA